MEIFNSPERILEALAEIVDLVDAGLVLARALRCFIIDTISPVTTHSDIKNHFMRIKLAGAIRLVRAREFTEVGIGRAPVVRVHRLSSLRDITREALGLIPEPHTDTLSILTEVALHSNNAAPFVVQIGAPRHRLGVVHSNSASTALIRFRIAVRKLGHTGLLLRIRRHVTVIFDVN